MARPTKYTIKLTDDERSKLKKAIKNKSTSKTVLKRYQILLVLDNDKGTALTYQQIAHSYAVCQTTISNIKRIYVDDGIDALLHNIISPNSAAALRKADGWTEAKLIQIACGPAPNGHSR